jgi:transposase
VLSGHGALHPIPVLSSPLPGCTVSSLVAFRFPGQSSRGHADGQPVVASREAFLTDASRRIRFVFTPKHCSWLNQVEIWFSVLARRVLKRGDFRSVDALEQKILAFIDYFNRVLARPAGRSRREPRRSTRRRISRRTSSKSLRTRAFEKRRRSRVTRPCGARFRCSGAARHCSRASCAAGGSDGRPRLPAAPAPPLPIFL